MSHTSPQSYLAWSIMSTFLGAFFLYHLWKFDRFRCLRWSSDAYNGAFKRIMTYTYFISIPLIMVYSYGFAIIKYNQGYTVLPGGGYIPTPYIFWPQSYKDAMFPLTVFFSIAWAFEMITHLEELCFWLFLVTVGPSQPDWFQSVFFRTWVFGSGTVLVGMPLVTSLSRGNPLRSEALTFLVGSLGSLTLTLLFIPVLVVFPSFLRKIQCEGVEVAVLVRLTKSYELNVIRVLFRFLFVLPLLALGIDGIKPHRHKLNESMFWTDLFAVLAAIGCAVSSIITLMIFFPRSHYAEFTTRGLVPKSGDGCKDMAPTVNMTDQFAKDPLVYDGLATPLTPTIPAPGAELGSATYPPVIRSKASEGDPPKPMGHPQAAPHSQPHSVWDANESVVPFPHSDNPYSPMPATPDTQNPFDSNPNLLQHSGITHSNTFTPVHRSEDGHFALLHTRFDSSQSNVLDFTRGAPSKHDEFADTADLPLPTGFQRRLRSKSDHHRRTASSSLSAVFPEPTSPRVSHFSHVTRNSARDRVRDSGSSATVTLANYQPGPVPFVKRTPSTTTMRAAGRGGSAGGEVSVRSSTAHRYGYGHRTGRQGNGEGTGNGVNVAIREYTSPIDIMMNGTARPSHPREARARDSYHFPQWI